MAKTTICTVCGATVLEIRPHTPRTHYVRGSNDECRGSNLEPVVEPLPTPGEAMMDLNEHDPTVSP